MQAVILAGGLGTRLRKVVADRPKAMAEINGRPFIEYQIRFLKKYDITSIVICTGYLSEKIESHFDDGRAFGVNIKYSKEDRQLGTGGALKNARNLLDEEFLVLNGDTLFLINLTRMVEEHYAKGADATIAVTKVNDPSQYGSILMDISNQRIISFIEKAGTDISFVNGGIYLFKKSSFQWYLLPTVFSLEKDHLPKLVSNSKVFGYKQIGSYFIDIGTPDTYARLNRDVVQLGDL